MSLSTCECGGHIPLGPDASNRCEKCGAGVFGFFQPDPNPPKNAAYWKRRALEAEEELAYRKNNFEQSCLWPSTIIQSDQLMPDGRPQKLAVVPNWCIHKIECNARKSKS